MAKPPFLLVSSDRETGVGATAIRLVHECLSE
jgi:hypothetical protein